jgi:hypothetical protein
MPIVFGKPANRVEEIVAAFRRHGDAVRGTYIARYVFDRHSRDPYRGAVLERPSSLAANPPDVCYPWEQIFVAAANCAGSDYPMLAAHFGVPLDRVEVVIEGVFDPRGEFDGLDDYHAPADAAPCFLSLHLRATLVSSAPRERLEAIHRRVMATNMVLGALRGIPKTSELVVSATAAPAVPGVRG